jgi:hypothetical protein
VLPHNKQNTPNFQPQICVSCSEPIRGARYYCTRDCFTTVALAADDKGVAETIQRPVILCETCARAPAHQPNHMKKMHKDCILASSISLDQGLRVCSCEKVQHRRQGSQQIYPFRAKDRRLHGHDCDLLRLATRHCRTKYEELNRSKQQHEESQKCQRESKGNFPEIMSQSQQGLPQNLLRRSPTTSSMSTVSSTSSNPEHKSTSGFAPLKGSLRRLVRRSRFKSLSALAGESTLENLSEETASLPSAQPGSSKASFANAKKTMKRHIFRPFAKVGVNHIPYGNVHMALMLGPLLIENGIKQYVISPILRTCYD